MTVLYKPTKTGATQQWQIEIQGDSFICTYGQLGGAMQKQTTKCSGKNIGKANQTTPEQQAILEAEALVTKKLKSGYSYEISDTPSVSLPMKVKSYQDQLHNIEFPCISTEKLNGVNAMFKRTSDSLTIYSRGGEVYPAIPHLEQHIHDIMDKLSHNELNAELYIHGEHLQDIQSAVKKPNSLSPKLTCNIFDIADSSEIYEYRRTKLMTIYKTLESIDHVSLKYIGFLTGVECHSHEQIELHYNQCMDNNLEGTVIKNFKALYQHNVRSSDMFKYKKTQDAEYQIVDCETDKNGHPVFHCLTEEGKLFKVKPKGTDAERKAIIANFESQYLNNWYKIEYEVFSKDGIPLKPVGIGLRDCDSNGQPKE